MLSLWQFETGTRTQVGQTWIESSPMILRVSYTIFISSRGVALVLRAADLRNQVERDRMGERFVLVFARRASLQCVPFSRSRWPATPAPLVA